MVQLLFAFTSDKKYNTKENKVLSCLFFLCPREFVADEIFKLKGDHCNNF